MMKCKANSVPFLLTGVTFIIFTQCVSTYHVYSLRDSLPSPSSPVLVYPFENLSSHQYGGDIATANFITELRSTCPFLVLDAEFLMLKKSNPQSGSDTEVDFSQMNKYSKVKLAMKKKVEYIVTGKVTEFRYKKGLGEEPVVGLNVQMINVKTRETVWHASISISRGLIGFGEQSLNTYSQRAIRKMVKRIRERLL